MLLNPFYKKPCAECDCPDFCGGEFCLRDTVSEDVHDSELSPVLMELEDDVQEPSRDNNQQTIDFIKNQIFR
jgi:hypothetical protein